ncbi:MULTISPECIES: light-harvesting antenna LH1, alpha subunit [Thiorhodococcus]|uniref:Antenna complex alpha/beta subunit n=2 Tax=Thiorhodococcus TaxID=57488 RepID=G2DXM8_9GAMM|nr:light-harvesting antenna LH1, alpha subunit [Thiorhodococcus drewsii]EGV33077.1 antenna complex alpha/beta subunit [Thiorhodococcus drewsii AZ1]
MHKIWLVFDPRMAIMGLAAFLLVLAFAIHYILMVSSSYYDFLQGPPISAEAAAQITPLPVAK